MTNHSWLFAKPTRLAWCSKRRRPIPKSSVHVTSSASISDKNLSLHTPSIWLSRSTVIVAKRMITRKLSKRIARGHLRSSSSLLTLKLAKSSQYGSARTRRSTKIAASNTSPWFKSKLPTSTHLKEQSHMSMISYTQFNLEIISKKRSLI